MLLFVVIFLLFFSKCTTQVNNEKIFKIGTGISDITGPAAELYMNMYGSFTQKTSGIRMRLFSRAVIIEDYECTRLCMVIIECGMADMLVKLEVIKRLKKYNGLYTESNVMISATHTHSSPAGYSQYVLYSSPGGFDRQNFEVIVNGIVASIDMAHENMAPGFIFYNEGELLGVSINRSPTAYENNPSEERKLYEYDTDKSMYILKLTDINGNPKGVVTWFAVHPTNLNNTNTYISSDNKGYAAYLFERNVRGQSPENMNFIAAFPNSNAGDSSPNIKGPICINNGNDCDKKSSTCDGDCTKCIASGPGEDMYSSATIIGEAIYKKAFELFQSASTQISGRIKYVHQYIDMSSVSVKIPDGRVVKTCKPAMGFSFAAGTVDGPGLKGFQQGEYKPSLFWVFVRNILFQKPSTQLSACHKPKMIFIPTGEMNIPYDWQPEVVPTQLFQIGDVFIAAAPSEFTTMCGRRLKNSLKRLTKSEKIIYNGYANAYSSYVATYEEYQVQRYEGGSTIYGPYTFIAYLQQFKKLAKSLITDVKLDKGPNPPDNSHVLLKLHFGVVFDTPGLFNFFGECILQPHPFYTIGSFLTVSFVSGHPKNNLMTDKTFFTIQRLNEETNTFETVITDAGPDAYFQWNRIAVSDSKITIYWTIGSDTIGGIYRIQHFGYYKTPIQTIYPYYGETRQFKVIT